MTYYDLPELINDRQARIKIMPAPFNMGAQVKLQLKWKRLPFWETVDNMVPYNSEDPDQPITELIQWATNELIDRTNRYFRQRDELFDVLDGNWEFRRA